MQRSHLTVSLILILILVLLPSVLAQESQSPILSSSWTGRLAGQLIYAYEDGATALRGTYKSRLSVTNTSLNTYAAVHYQFYTWQLAEYFDFIDILTPGQTLAIDPSGIRTSPLSNTPNVLRGYATGGRYVMTVTPIDPRNEPGSMKAIAFNQLLGQISVTHLESGSTCVMNAIGRLAVNSQGEPVSYGTASYNYARDNMSTAVNYAAGNILDGSSMLFQKIRPKSLLLKSFLATSSAAGHIRQGIPFGNRLAFLAFEDNYATTSNWYRLEPGSASLTANVYSGSVSSMVQAVPAKTVTNLDEFTVAPSVLVKGNFGDFLELSIPNSFQDSGGWVNIGSTISAANGNLVGWFSQNGPTSSGGDYLIGSGLDTTRLADLKISKLLKTSGILPGQTLRYQITATNGGPYAAARVVVADTLPGVMSKVSWTCTATAGSTCVSAQGTGNLDTHVDLAVDGSVTFLVDATLSSAARGIVVNTATVTSALGVIDPVPVNNTSTHRLSRLPEVESVEPAKVLAAQVTPLLIHGNHFFSGATAFVGDTPLTGVVVAGPTQISANLPAGKEPGLYPLRICTPVVGAVGGQSYCDSLRNAITVTGPGPVLRAVSPGWGYNTDDMEILLAGENFAHGMTVKLGTLVLASRRPGPTSALAWVPKGIAAGFHDVSVQNPGVGAISTLTKGYLSLAPGADDFFLKEEDIWVRPYAPVAGSTVQLGANIHRLGGTGDVQPLVNFYLCETGATPPGTFLGNAFTATPLVANDSSSFAAISWDIPGHLTEADIYVQIPGIPGETTPVNNQAHRVISLRTHVDDPTPPAIRSLTLNQGAEDAARRLIPVSLAATDGTGGTGLESMLFMEMRYSSAVRSWIMVQNTGWIPFASNSWLVLAPEGGVHYVRAWVRDSRGNISHPKGALVNYLPSTEAIRLGEVRLYRKFLTAGQKLTATLSTLVGNADLEVWGPGGILGSSRNSGLIQDVVSITAAESGIVWVAVSGISNSIYSLQFANAAYSGVYRAAVIAGPAGGIAPISNGNDPPIDGAIPDLPVNPEDALFHLQLPVLLR